MCPTDEPVQVLAETALSWQGARWQRVRVPAVVPEEGMLTLTQKARFPRTSEGPRQESATLLL